MHIDFQILLYVLTENYCHALDPIDYLYLSSTIRLQRLYCTHWQHCRISKCAMKNIRIKVKLKNVLSCFLFRFKMLTFVRKKLLKILAFDSYLDDVMHFSGKKTFLEPAVLILEKKLFNCALDNIHLYIQLLPDVSDSFTKSATLHDSVTARREAI